MNAFAVDLLAFVEIDGTPRVSLEARIEEARGIIQGRPFVEGHLHDGFVGLAGAQDPVVVPHRYPSPFPFLDDVGIGFFDQ